MIMIKLTGGYFDRNNLTEIFATLQQMLKEILQLRILNKQFN